MTKLYEEWVSLREKIKDAIDNSRDYKENEKLFLQFMEKTSQVIESQGKSIVRLETKQEGMIVKLSIAISTGSAVIAYLVSNLT